MLLIESENKREKMVYGAIGYARHIDSGKKGAEVGGLPRYRAS